VEEKIMQARFTWAAAGLFIGALLASACGSTDPAAGDMQEAMTATVTAFDTQVKAVDKLATTHAATIAAAADLAAVSAEEAKHMDGTMAAHHEMGTLLDHMAMCAQDGKAPNTDAMSLRVDDLGKEIEAHMKAMDAAADMTAAATEESRHQAALAAFVADMNKEDTAMTKMADSYMCPMGHM
jgi:hypothetical protein